MSSMTTSLARSRRLAKSAKAYNREAEPTVTVAASDAAVTAAYKRGLKEGEAAGYEHGANNAHAAAAEIIADVRRAAAKEQVKFVEGIIESMDREMVQGWMNVVAEMNKRNPHAEMFMMSVPITNAICRELGRAYDLEGRLPSEDDAPPAKGS
jgi:hypothetical protein